MGMNTQALVDALDSHLSIIWNQLQQLEQDTAIVQAKRDTLWNEYNLLLAKRADALLDAKE